MRLVTKAKDEDVEQVWSSQRVCVRRQRGAKTRRVGSEALTRRGMRGRARAARRDA